MSTILLSCLLAATLLFSLASCEGIEHRSTWMLLEITHDGKTRLLAAKKSASPPSKCKGYPTTPDDHVMVMYTHPEHKSECAVPIRNPRKMYHDHATGNGKFGGGVHHHDTIEFAVTVHHEVTEFHTHDFKNPHMAARHFVTEEHMRNFETLNKVITLDPSLVESLTDSGTSQVVGPVEEQMNIVFLSSGYTIGQIDDFKADVKKLVDFMQLDNQVPGLSSQPYRRYFSATNVWSLFYPSQNSGASHPAPAGDGSVRDNALGCTYGETSSRTLTCSRAKVQLLGSYAPPDPTSTQYIVLVNDGTFGGTGGSGICTTYNGAKMPVIFIHEMAHSLADLADEYSYGYSESQQINLKNCHWNNAVDEVPWSRWITSGVLGQPSQVCTYNNYFKPTAGACLMESEQASYCPVCQSATLEEMYNHGVNLASPMHPNKYETTYVKEGEELYLWINNKIPFGKDETGTFDVQWKSPAGAVIQTGGAFVTIGPLANATLQYTGPGNYSVSVEITDNTNMFLASTRQTLNNRNSNNATALRQVHTFRVEVVSAASTPNCTSKTYNSRGYCARCDDGRQAYCNLSFSARPLESTTEVVGTLEGIQAWLMGIGAVFVAIGVMIFVLIWRTMALHAEHNPREVLPLGQKIMVVRILLLVMQVALLLGCTFAIIFSVYMYGQLTIFGRTIVLGIIASSVVCWFASFVGFCASYYKNRSVLFVNFILLLLLFGCALLFTVLLLYMLFNIDSNGVKDQLRAEWEKAVAEDPQAACTLQSVLECSGFNTSCSTLANIPQGSSNCPANCELSNKYADPCFLRVKQFVKDKFGTASVGGIVLSVFILISMILSLVLGCSIKTKRNTIHRERRRRYNEGEQTLTDEEVGMLRNEFRKIDKDGSGDISRLEFSNFYNAVMGANLSPRELEEYFDKLDSDGNGVLSFEEFLKCYTPQEQPKRRSFVEGSGALYRMDSMISPDQIALEEQDEVGAAADDYADATLQKPAMTDDADLDLALHDDQDELSPEEAARIKEEQAREEQARVAEAEAERLKRMQMDRPSNIDVELALDDSRMNQMLDTLGTTNANGTTQGNNMDLDVDLDE